MDEAHIDFETHSTTDLRKAGVARYTEDPHTGVFGFTWRINAGPLHRWRPGMTDPAELLHHIRQGKRVVAHNAGFERWIWNVTLRARYKLHHWPVLTIEQQDCTLARAAAVALPQDLDTLAEVLNQRERKDREGHNLMLKMSKPRRVRSDGTPEWWHESPEGPAMLARLEAYQDQDVRTESETHTLLPPLTERERRIWELDQRINDRGVCFDIQSVTRAVDVVFLAKKDADKRMATVTQGAVKKTTEVAKLVAWIQSCGIEIDELKKSHQDEVIAIAGYAGYSHVRQAVEIRKEAAKTSVAKYGKMLECICSDDRIYGLLQYCGAMRTGRWAGRLVQPQNFPRMDPDRDGQMVEHVSWVLQQHVPASEALELIKCGGYDPLPALAKSLRAMIVAAPGNKLLGADFSNIEGRINAWLAGEEWKLQAFRAYDDGTGPDLYKLAYSRSFGVPVEQVGKGEKRQIGKVQELALGFQGGVGALLNMADTYNMKVHELEKPVREASSAQQWDEMAVRYAKATDKFGLPEAVWTACKLVVAKWRTAHPNIMQGWWDLQDAAIAAVDQPGTMFPVYNGHAWYVVYDNWLYCQLPSGRVICYANPWINETTQTLVNKDGEEYERVKRTVHFVGLDGITKQWQDMYLYGGEQCNNIVQATARCLMDHAMERVEAKGYSLVLTVHDELLAEVQKEFGSVHEFKGLMAEMPVWANGLPVAAAAWEDTRYVK